MRERFGVALNKENRHKMIDFFLNEEHEGMFGRMRE